MSEHERFTAFLRDAAAGYHDPPETPREEMWREIEGARGAGAEAPSQWIAGDDELAGAAASYHAPPATPHEDMWGRIEAAWELRRSAPPAAREAGLEALPERPLGDDAAHRPAGRRRALAAAGAVLAMAASLVIGIAIGRGSIGAFGGADGAPRIAAADGAGAASDGDAPDAAGAGTPPARDDAGSPPRSRSTRQVAIGYATAKHLGQAETLLTSFRADSDADPETVAGLEETALSEWARVLLADTRLLLDLPMERPETERALLEELELVLAQVARLGPGAPAFERDLIAESIEREGTIARLRAAAPPGASARLTGT